MSVETVDTLVVGAGQAGVAMSEHLSTCGVPHLVVERHRIAECWRSERWDSLVANGPAWHDRFPGMEFPDTHADAFVHKEKVADYFVAYASQISAPVRCGVEVKVVHRDVGRRGFRIRTSDRVIEANNVVAATGAFQRPVTPALIPGSVGLMQIHSNSYKPVAGGCSTGGWRRILWGADRGRTLAFGQARLLVGRAAQSPAAFISPARLLLV